MVKRFSHNWVKYRIWPGERLVRVCWTTHRTKWSDTNAMDTKLKISLSHRTPSVTIQKCGLPGLQSLLEMETQDSITGRPCYQPTGLSFTKICLSMKVNGVIRFLQVDQKAANGFCRVRMGVIGDEQDGCSSSDSRIGFGEGGSGYENAWEKELRGVRTMEKKQYQGVQIHLPLVKTLNCSTQGKSCMQHGVMIKL